jgi:hypothetical protein
MTSRTLLALLVATFAAPAVQAAPAADFGDIGWIDGVQRRIYGSFSVAPKAAGTVDVFVAGPVDGAHPLDDVTLDPHFPYVHDHVCPKVPYGESKLVRFMVLRPGPNATAGNLRTRTVHANHDIPWIENEDGSFPITEDLEMPYAIDLGAGFVPLTSVAVVQAGFAAGILRTVQIAGYLTVTGWTGGTIESE